MLGCLACSSSDPAAPASDLVADLGFRAATDGFSFQNYVNSAVEVNLTPEDLRLLVGDEACAALIEDECLLTPPAQMFLQEASDGMDGGHCEGMAVLSLAMFLGDAQASDFGADTIGELELTGNTALQREIGRYFATQFLEPTASNRIGSDGGPGAVVDALVEAFRSGADAYRLAFFQPDFSGGHAITPYAVRDLGNGMQHILVYDNNFPHEERYMEVDRVAETWSYFAAADPSIEAARYEGSATTGTLWLTPQSVRYVKQECSFCLEGSDPSGSYNTVRATGEGNIVITDDDGNTTGVVDGVVVNDIPGAFVNPSTSADLWRDNSQPSYRIPVTVGFSIRLDGSNLTEPSHTSVLMLGPGYAAQVNDVALDPGQTDTMLFAKDGDSARYETAGDESPLLSLGFEASGADWSFSIAATGEASGVTVAAALDRDLERVAITTETASAFAIFVRRVAASDGAQEFSHAGNALDDGDTGYLDYGSWAGNGSTMQLEIDRGTTGTIDETLQLSDED